MGNIKILVHEVDVLYIVLIIKKPLNSMCDNGFEE
jgi:hypothetical protein